MKWIHVFTTIVSVCMGVSRYLHLEETYEVKLTHDANNFTNLDVDWLEARKRGRDKFFVKNLVVGVRLTSMP